MKISVEFKTEEEKDAYLGMVALTMNPPTTDLVAIEASFIKHLELVAQMIYIEGAGKKVQIEQAPTLKSEAATFFV